MPILAMHAEDIKAAIRKAGSTQASIARALDVSRMAVGHVVSANSKSRRIATAVSQVVGIPIAELWPGKYPDLEKFARGRAAIAKQLDAERQEPIEAGVHRLFHTAAKRGKKKAA